MMAMKMNGANGAAAAGAGGGITKADLGNCCGILTLKLLESSKDQFWFLTDQPPYKM